MKNYFAFALGPTAFAAACVTPALARYIRYSAAQVSRQMDLYAMPDGPRIAGPLPPQAVTVNGQVVGDDSDPRIRLSLICEFFFNK